jgi:hypothetical protein
MTGYCGGLEVFTTPDRLWVDAESAGDAAWDVKPPHTSEQNAAMAITTAFEIVPVDVPFSLVTTRPSKARHPIKAGATNTPQRSAFG